MLLIQTNKMFVEDVDQKIEDVDKKIPDTSIFIETKDFNRLTKINVNARIEEASRNLGFKDHVETALDLGDKNGEKIKKNFKF